ncbi:MAG: hypothetical protein IPK60_23995 [Sandaracinaceae bacterium]|nr:hypothetical protein [Sandaracinaceae bacterium]
MGFARFGDLLYCGMRIGTAALTLLLVACGSSAEASLDAGIDARDAGYDANPAPDLGPMCSEECGAGGACCSAASGGECRAILVDALNCGICGNSCLNGKGTECQTGQCVCGEILEGCNGTRRSFCCPPHDIIVQSYCANFDLDATDCGECGHVCEPMLADQCSGGHCYCGTEARACAGTANDLCCVNEFEEGNCVDTSNDDRNCGACNVVCNGALGQHCVDSMCTTAP